MSLRGAILGCRRRPGCRGRVDSVDDDLGLTLGLHVSSHDTEGHPGLAVFGGEAGDDGLEGAFAGLVEVGMAVLQGEEFGAILEHEAEAVGDEA